MVVVGVLLALLLVAELVAVPIATRALGSALGQCIRHGSVTIEQVGRPILPLLLVGRARDVVLRVEDAQLEGLVIAEATVEAARVVLPWALGDPQPGPATVHLVIDEGAVADRLGAMTPLGIRPDVAIDRGRARVGVANLPLEVSLGLTVREDGALVLVPGAGLPDWWDRLGIGLVFELPDEVRVDAVALDDRSLTASLHLDELPGADGEGCDEPIAGTAP